LMDALWRIAPPRGGCWNAVQARGGLRYANPPCEPGSGLQRPRDAETDLIGAVARKEPQARGRAQHLRGVEPGSTAQHAAAAIGPLGRRRPVEIGLLIAPTPAVGGPLVDVAVDLIETKGVRSKRVHRN